VTGTLSSRTEAPPADPGRLIRIFATALGSGDLDGATACFARDACLVTPDSTAIRGRSSIRPVLAQLALVRTEIAIELSSALVVADVALLRGHCTIRSNGADGVPFDRATSPIVVAQWIEAQWKLQIAAFWG
jgi:ketosteroid isomerase-like protein